MKNILFFLLLITSVASAQDSTRFSILTDRGWVGARLNGIPTYKLDGVRAAVIGGDTILNTGNGNWSLQNVGVYQDANAATRLNAAFALPFVYTLHVRYDTAKVISLTSNINAKGKKLVAAKGVRFTGTVTIDSLWLDVDPDDHVFDTGFVFTNFRTIKGYVTPKNFGAPNNGTGDDAGYIEYAAKVAAANSQSVFIFGNNRIADTVRLDAKAELYGQKGNHIIVEHGNYISYRTASAPIDSVVVDGLNMTSTGSYTTAESLLKFYTSSSSTRNSRGLKITNNVLNCNRLAYWPIHIYGVDGADIMYNVVNESRSTSIVFEYCNFPRADYNTVVKSGRAGISVIRYNNDWAIRNNIIRGYGQYEDLTDGGIDGYGIRNLRGIVHGNHIDTDTITGAGNNTHIGIRIKGSTGTIVENNTIVMRGDHYLYAVTQTERDGYAGRSNSVRGNKIYLQGRYRRIFNMQGNLDGDFSDNEIIIDTSAYAGTTPTLLYIASHSTVDTVNRVIARNNIIKAGGKQIHMLENSTPIHYVDLSGTILDSIPNTAFAYTTSPYDSIGVVSWNGGRITCTNDTGYVFRVQPRIGTFQITNVHTKKPASSSSFMATPGANSLVIAGLNTFNGQPAPTYNYTGVSSGDVEVAIENAIDTLPRISISPNVKVEAGDSVTVLLDAGSYTPTIGNTTNIASSTPTGFTYTRIGKYVTVTGYITLTHTSASTTSGFTITLPIASDLGSGSDLKGHLTGGYSGADQYYAMVRGEGTLNVAALNYKCTTTSSDQATVSFTYEIK